MSIKHAILGLLTTGPLHGYGLKAAYEEHLVPGPKLNIGQVYPALDKLEQEGLVTCEVIPQPERPDRKVYTLTDAGRAELASWLGEASKPETDARNETYLKLMLAWHLSRQSPPGADPLAIVDAERRACLAELHKYTALRASEQRKGSPIPTLLLLDLAVARLDALYQWLDRCEESFRRGGKP